MAGTQGSKRVKPSGSPAKKNTAGHVSWRIISAQAIYNSNIGMIQLPLPGRKGATKTSDQVRRRVLSPQDASSKLPAPACKTD